MANRLTDSRKWDDGWFVELDPAYKLMWLYILDKCNHAGIYKINRRLEEALLGFPLDLESEHFSKRIRSLGDEKFFIPKFIEFQYKVSMDKLDPKYKVHKSVIDILEKERVSVGYPYPKDRCKDKDKDKDKGGVGGFEFTPPKEEMDELKKKLNKTGKI